jgi:type II secretory pathway pseudopilin PulG
VRHGRSESGFALLLVFLMAALVAISLYMEIPRVAFETQRQKEELLVERGEQYKRAIKLFVSPKGMGHWPAKIEDLENTNNRRFLRHRFVDPFTGKADWRLVHIQNGMLTDSVVNKPKNPLDPKDASSSAVQSSVSALSGVSALPGAGGAGSNAGQQNMNAALRRRASEGGANPGAIGPDGQPVLGPDGQPYPGMQPYPGTQPYPGAQPYPDPSAPQSGGQAPPNPGLQMPGGAPGFGAQPGSPGSTMPGFQPGQFPGQSPQYPGMPGMPVNSQTGGVSPVPYPIQPGSQGQPPNFGQPGMQGAVNPAQQAAAAAIINQILMTPNPRGLAGIQNAQNGIMGGGIAGVASKEESDSIMIYNDREKYNEWEFVYDPTKEKPLPNPNGGGTMPMPGFQTGSNTFAPGPSPGGAGATMTPAPATTPGAKQ